MDQSDATFSLSFIVMLIKDLYLSVLIEQESAPSVFPLVSCCSSTAEGFQGSVTFACLAAGYFPSNAEITWEPHDASRIRTFPEIITAGSNALYSRSSQVTVPSAEVEKNSYTCIVKHSAIKQQGGTRKRIDSKEWVKRPPTPIRVRLLTPDCDAENTETDLELVCVLLSSGPGQAKVEWLINGAVEQNKESMNLTGQKSSGYSSYITQNITKKSWDEGDHYTCRVTHLLKNRNAEMYNTSKCKACYKSMQVPAISITEPSYRDLVEGTAAVTCLVEGFFLEKIQITWNVDGKPTTRPQPEIVKTDAGGRPNAKSSHSVSPQQWEKGTTFQCKVATMCLEEITKAVTIKKDTSEQAMMPTITISQAFRDTSSNSTIAQILVCDVNGFFPMEISISWKKNSILLNTSLYDNGPVVSSGKVYTTYSILKIGRSEGGNGRDSYTCVVHHSSSPKPITADEAVSSDLPKPQAPTVELLQSVDQEKKTVTLKCVASDYWPEKVTISWKGSLPREPVTFTGQKMSNGRYTASSQIEITFSQWQEGENNACEVVHKESNFKSLKTVSRKDWIMPTALTLSLSTDPHCPSLALSDDSNITLLCSINGYLEDIEITWEAGGKVQKSQKMDRPQGKGDQFHTTSNLTVPLKEWNELQEYTCKVTQLGKNITQTSRISKCTACKGSIPPPSLYLLKPSLEGLLIQRKALLTCLVVGYELDHGILTWMVGGVKDSKNSITGNVTNHRNKTQSLGSQLVISREAWNSGSQVQCTISHSCSLFPKKTEIIQHIQDANKVKAPSLSWVSPSPTQLMQQTSRAVAWLECIASGFLPAEILFRWKKNDSDVDPSEYITGVPAAKDGSPTFTTQSILKIPSSEWESRTLYTCMVGHESSPDMYNISQVFYDLPKPQAPTVELLQSVDQEKKTVTLKCVASDYWPEKVTISWKGSLPREPVPFTGQKMSNGRYTASSQIEITFSQWQEGDNNACEVVHKESNFKSLKTVSRKDWIMPTALTLSLSTDPHCPSLALSNDSNITLLCSINGYLEDIEVTWEAGGKVQKSQKMDHPQGNGDQFHTTSNLTVPLKEWNELQEYTCKVTQLGKNITQTSRISKCTACKGSIPPPSLYLLKPSLEGLLIQRKALLTCLVVGYELDHGILTWIVGGVKDSKNSITGNVTNHKNKTQSLGSHLVISREAWNSGSQVQCAVSHSCSLFPKKTEIIQHIQDPNKVKAPSLSWVSPSPTQLMQQTSRAVAWLECIASGFLPAEILFRWKKNDSDVDPSEYITGVPAAKDGGPTFTAQSILKIPSSEWESRTLYTCTVGHESSPDMYNISQVFYGFLEPVSPQVMAFHTSAEEARHTLICFATGFHPKNIDIQWSVPGMNLSCSSNSSALVALSDGKYQKSCNLALSEEEWREPQTYTCTVNHSSTNTLTKKVLHSSGMSSAPINTTIIPMKPPSFEDLFTNKSAALTCMAPLTDAMMNWTVLWLMDGQPANTQAVTTEVLNKTTDTAWICSQLEVNLTEWKGTIKFTCSISTGLEEVTQLYETRHGTMKPPKVSLQQQTSKEDLNVTLFCIATDFYPGEVFVKWQEENTEMSLKGHDAHNLKCDHEREACSLLSILEVSRSQWMMGVSYTCLVAHVSSPNIIFRRANSHSASWDCAVTSADICGICNETVDEYSELPEMDGAWNRVSTYLILFLLALFYGGLVTFFKVK